MKKMVGLLGVVVALAVFAQPTMETDPVAQKGSFANCVGSDVSSWDKCVGTFTYKNGNTYTGEYQKGKRNGYGKIRIVAKGKSDATAIRSETPATYEGQFKNDKISGLGVWVLDTGERYEGRFQNNVYLGKENSNQAPKEASPKPSDSYTTGSGFFVTKDGMFVTNWHVVENANSVSVLGFDGKMKDAVVLGKDISNDLAILRVEGGAKQWLKLASDSSVYKRGTEVITVGYPLASFQGFEPKVTSGIISSLSAIQDDPRRFQITVPIQSGNSGGPLVSHDGLVIGIINSKLSRKAVLEQTGGTPENVNYAIKSNYLLELLRNHSVRADFQTSKPDRSLQLPELTQLVEKASGMVFAEDKKAK